jgi:hypothetical protein
MQKEQSFNDIGLNPKRLERVKEYESKQKDYS